MPRVTVIIPAYNHAPYVRQAVESVLRQSFTDLQLLVNDDASTDATADIVASFSDPRLTLKVAARNLGASHQVNDALSRAEGEYIAILNSDDYFLPDKLAEQVAFLDAHPQVGAVFGLPWFIDEAGEPLRPECNPFRSLFIGTNMPRRKWLNRFFCISNALCHPTVMVRRACYDEVGGYDARLAQLPDFDLWIKIASRHELHILAKPLTAFRVLAGERNASGGSQVAKIRHDWELQFVLRRYLELPDDELNLIFESEFQALESSVASNPRVLLGRLALGIGPSAWARSSYLAFGLRVLFDELEDGTIGITGPEYMKLAGAVDPFNLGLHQTVREVGRERETLRSELEAIRNSRSWKASAPLRAASTALTGVRNNLAASRR